MRKIKAGRGLCGLLAALGVFLLPGFAAIAADYPDRPISFVVT